MSYVVEFADTARADINAIVDFIARENPRRAFTFVDEIETRIRSKLETFPLSGVQIGNYRYLVFAGYVAVYAFNEPTRTSVVVMICEGHRNWRAAYEP